MGKAIVKYLLVFLVGGVSTYLVLSNSDENTPSPTFLDLSITKSPSVPNENLADNKPVTTTKNDNGDEIDGGCEDQSKQLQQQLTQSVQIQTQLKNEFDSQITEVVKENQILKHRLEMLEPSDVTDADLKELIPAPYNISLTGLPPKLKQDISDFHQQEPDLDWGYRKQQQLTDFITTHVNNEYIKLTSISCKINQCEIIIDEKINLESMIQQGLSAQEIQSITDTQQPKYKQIFDDITTTPALNIRPMLHMPNRFGMYMLLKEKTASS